MSVGYSGRQHPKKDLLASEPSIMEDCSPTKSLGVADGSGDASESIELTTNAEVSIASEFDYDPSKYLGSTI